MIKLVMIVNVNIGTLKSAREGDFSGDILKDVSREMAWMEESGIELESIREFGESEENRRDSNTI